MMSTPILLGFARFRSICLKIGFGRILSSCLAASSALFAAHTSGATRKSDQSGIRSGCRPRQLKPNAHDSTSNA